MLEELAGLWVPVKAVSPQETIVEKQPEKAVASQRTPEEVAAFVATLKKKPPAGI